MKDIQKAIGELVLKQAEQERLRVSEDNREFFIKQSASAYSSAIAYANANANANANVIVLAGYAGIFSIWGLLKGDLPLDVVAIVAILTIVSLSIFVGFEMFKMVSTSVAAFKVGEFIEEGVIPYWV